MNYFLFVSFSFTILVAAAIGAIKFKKIDASFYPFIYCIWLATVNEIISFLLTTHHINTAPTNNIYVLAEALLIGWQFKKWKMMSAYKYAFSLYVALMMVVWLAEYFPFTELIAIKSGFRIISAIIIVLLSINLNCKLIFESNRKLMFTPMFVFGTAFIIYFTYRIFIESFLYKGFYIDTGLYTKIFVILSVINLLCNLLYAFALLCIHRKIYYLEPY
jgi:hypothetical protein